ncbi:hypothetical protein BDZ89DRAFT_1134495 [Hymenopellis radicata]|nr:hypothetical protein BDZ89DRAFT_1134495 [Hymenopellis radicata]
MKAFFFLASLQSSDPGQPRQCNKIVALSLASYLSTSVYAAATPCEQIEKAISSSSSVYYPGSSNYTHIDSPTNRDSESVDDAFEEVLLLLSDARTTVTETPLAMLFAVDGKATIPSDGVEHQVAVAVSSVILCQVKNTSESRLLPGSVRVIMDDYFVSQTTILNDVITGDTFDCTLGHDPTAKITHTRNVKTTRSGGGLSPSRSRLWRIRRAWVPLLITLAPPPWLHRRWEVSSQTVRSPSLLTRIDTHEDVSTPVVDAPVVQAEVQASWVT